MIQQGGSGRGTAGTVLWRVRGTPARLVNLATERRMRWTWFMMTSCRAGPDGQAIAARAHDGGCTLGGDWLAIDKAEGGRHRWRAEPVKNGTSPLRVLPVCAGRF
jgi:hypothetical protein